MEKFLKIFIVYTFGILTVLSFVWRASSLDRNNNSLAINYNNVETNCNE